MGGDAEVMAPSTKVDELLTSGLLIIIQVAVVIAVGVINFQYATTMDAFHYTAFRDVNIMIFFGFGFLMTFLHNHGLSAVGFTLVMSAVAIELSLVVEHIVLNKDHGDHGPELHLENLLNGLFCSGAVMISFGAVLGKVTPFQLLLMTVIEVFGFWVNFRVSTIDNVAHDVGGGLVIHTFGAYFGLAATFWVSRKSAVHHAAEKAIYSSDLFSMAGTIMLWVLWPSFQAAVAVGPQRQMLAATNTFVSLCSSTFAFAVITRFLTEHKFNVVHMQNATLAGGVAMGVAGDMEMGLYGAMISGFVAGTLSCVGYAKIQPMLTQVFGIHDTCGVHNLHGMPGILSGVIAVVVTGMHKANPGENDTKGFLEVEADNQIYALLISFAMALAWGTLAGILMTLPWKKLGVFVPDEYLYSDALFFEAAPVADEPASKAHA